MSSRFLRIIIAQSIFLKLISSQQVKQYVSVAPPPNIPSGPPPVVVRRTSGPYSSYPPSYTSNGPTYIPYETGSTYTPAVYSSVPDYPPTSYAVPSREYASVPTSYETRLPPETSRLPLPSEFSRYGPFLPTYGSGYKPLPSPPEQIPSPPPGYKIVNPPGYPMSSTTAYPLSSLSGYKHAPSPEFRPLSLTSTRPEYSISSQSLYTTETSAPASISSFKTLTMPCQLPSVSDDKLPKYSIIPKILKTPLPSVSLPNATPTSDLSSPPQTNPTISSSLTRSIEKSSSENPKSSEESKEKGVDSKLLNNLAVALQLLIVSNILNMPAPSEENSPLRGIYESVTSMDLPSSNLPSAIDNSKSSPTSLADKNTCPTANQPNSLNYESNIIDQIPLKSFQQICETSAQIPTSPFQRYYELLEQSPLKSIQQLPNAKFLSSSGFGGTSLGSLPLSSFGIGTMGLNGVGSNGYSNPRSNFALMSPYEALGSNSPYSDPILTSPYGNSFNANDFKSPYSAMLAENDLFSMADIF